MYLNIKIGSSWKQRRGNKYCTIAHAAKYLAVKIDTFFLIVVETFSKSFLKKYPIYIETLKDTASTNHLETRYKMQYKIHMFQ